VSDDPLLQLRTLTRQRLRLIWEIEQQGGTLNEEDALTARLMREHPEWHGVWLRADKLSDAEFERGGVNPHLHIIAHQIVMNQAAGALPAVGETLEALVAKGVDRHEAIHRIGAILMEYMFRVLKHKRPFDEARYLRKVRALLKDVE